MPKKDFAFATEHDFMNALYLLVALIGGLDVMEDNGFTIDIDAHTICLPMNVPISMVQDYLELNQCNFEVQHVMSYPDKVAAWDAADRSNECVELLSL